MKMSKILALVLVVVMLFTCLVACKPNNNNENNNEVTDPSDDCGCNCHKSGISNFFFKFALFFQKLFDPVRYSAAIMQIHFGVCRQDLFGVLAFAIPVLI